MAGWLLTLAFPLGLLSEALDETSGWINEGLNSVQLRRPPSSRLGRAEVTENLWRCQRVPLTL